MVNNNGKIATKKEPIRTLGFTCTSIPPYHTSNLKSLLPAEQEKIFT